MKRYIPATLKIIQFAGFWVTSDGSRKTTSQKTQVKYRVEGIKREISASLEIRLIVSLRMIAGWKQSIRMFLRKTTLKNQKSE